MQGFPPHGGYGMPPQQIPPGYAQPMGAYPPNARPVVVQPGYAQQPYQNPMAAYTYNTYGSRLNLQQIDSDCQSLRKAVKDIKLYSEEI